MLQFGPYISEKEKENLIPTIEAFMKTIPYEIAKNGFNYQTENLQLKAFSKNSSIEYMAEKDCILALQTTESVPILVAYDDGAYVFILDVVDGQNLPTHCKEQGISIFSYEEELTTALQSMLKKGWYIQLPDLSNVIWCEDCDALFIVDYSGCTRLPEEATFEHSDLIIANVKSLFRDVDLTQESYS